MCASLGSQISRHHLRVIANLLGLSFGDLPTRIHDDDLIGNAHDEPNDMFYHDDRHTPLVADLAKEPLEFGYTIDRKPDRRLVEQHNFGVADKCPRDLNNPLLTEG